MSQDYILCDAYKSAKKDETYLFVDRLQGLQDLPEDLLTQFPNPELVTSFRLTPDRKMARVSAIKVMQGIRKQGYYLQMPPPKNAFLDSVVDQHASSIAEKNEKLKR